jgi:hypothetical protein
MSARLGRRRPVALLQRSGARHVIPFDHAVAFKLEGRPGRVAQGVVNVGPDGVFVATAIGYGFEEERGRPLQLARRDEVSRDLPGDITLGQLPLAALIEGLRIAPRHENLWFDTDQASFPLRDEPLSPGQLDLVLERVRTPRDDLSFLFTLADSASGRELQDEPALNLASLGSPRGERPFRPLAQPVQFLPRTTVRLQVEERTFDRQGTLFVVLYGHKVLTSSVCPEPMQRAVQALMHPPPIERTVPFDYVARVELEGRPGRRVETEIPVSAEGAFVATAIGYGLAPEDRRVHLDFSQVPQVSNFALRSRLSVFLLASRVAAPGARLAAGTPFDLSDLPLRCFGSAALRDGFRLRPDFVHLALDGSGGLARLDGSLIDELFETLNRPEDVSFRFGWHDTGVGVDLQNQLLHNVAGLGRADGERPFKRLTPAMQLFPRATLRLTVQEHLGRGSLFFALHGFKRLDVGAVPAVAATALRARA